MKSVQRVATQLLAFATGISFVLVPYTSALLPTAQAAVADWQKGATMVPQSTTDFGSPGFQASLQQLRNTGANAVALVVPYYQSNTGSVDIQPGWNTPTDASLGQAIDEAHTLGMSVTIKMLDNPYDGSWRAYINPGDRNGWFSAYQNYLVHLAQIAQAHHAEMIDIGTELVSMTSTSIDPNNTSHWVSMIQAVRGVYAGKLIYGANSNDNSSSPYTDEKRFVGFWPYLDYVGLSAYYNLQYNGSVQSLEGSWDYWNKNDLAGFQQSVGKPIIFMEVGYRSVSGTSEQPWNWGMGGSYAPQEQADDYNALMTYWNNYSYMTGVYFWDWSTNPNAGGSGNTDYTPQNKPAQQILTQWFGSPTTPTTQQGANQPAGFSSSASANPGGVNAGTPTSIMATLTAAGGPASSVLVDVEIYNQSGAKAYQTFYPNQSFNAGETRNFTFDWAPQTAGTYRVTIGVFTNDWSKTLYWNDNALNITVGSGSGNTGGGTSTTTSSGGGSTGGSTGGGTQTSSGKGSVDQSGQTFRAGSTLDFIGRNFVPEQNITVHLNGSIVAAAHSDGGGNFSTGSVPAPSVPGSYNYIFTDPAGDMVTATITITQ